MTNEQLAKEIEELSVHEQAAGPPTSTRGPCPDPNFGNGGVPPAGLREKRPATQEMVLVGATSSASAKLTTVTKNINLEAPPHATVSAADNSSLPLPASPRTREYNAKRKAKRKRQAENRRRKRAAESASEKFSSLSELPPSR